MRNGARNPPPPRAGAGAWEASAAVGAASAAISWKPTSPTAGSGASAVTGPVSGTVSRTVALDGAPAQAQPKRFPARAVAPAVNYPYLGHRPSRAAHEHRLWEARPIGLDAAHRREDLRHKPAQRQREIGDDTTVRGVAHL